MPLTTFGLTCRQHRVRNSAVMADQSSATGVPISAISRVERGDVAVPDGYVAEVVEWMQLDRLEALQLKKLAQLHPSWPKKRLNVNSASDLKSVLNELAFNKNLSE